MKHRLIPIVLVAMLALAASGVTVRAATINVPGSQPDIQSAINVAAPNDVILVAPGTYVIGTTINVTVAGLTIQGSGSGSTTLQVASAVGDGFAITSSGTTLRDFTIEKTDLPGAPHHLVWINANNVTVRDNVFFGPVPGTPWGVNGIVSRAMIVSPGLTGLLIQGNTISHLRQPAYIDGPSGVLRGSIINNHVSGTRGWVMAGAKMTFSGNTWGPPENEGAEIALLSTCTVADYPNLLALSTANGNAYISDQFSGGPSGRAIAYVDDSAAPGGFGSSLAPYQTVGGGVGNTLPGATVQVAAGTYTEQVVVSGKNLTIQGAGRASTFIVSPVTLATSFTTSAANFPVVLAQNAADIRMRDLTVDGNGKGNTNYRFMGVAFWNAGGKLLDCDVVRVRNTPLDGSQHGNAVYAFNNAGGPYAVEVGGCSVSDFQKNGITMNGTGLTANVHDCVVTGAGATGITAQNGIQVAFGANGTITNCAVSNIGYTGPGYVACGALLMGGGTMTLSGGSITNCQFGCYMYDVNGSVGGVAISTSFAPGGGGYPAYGVGVYNTTASGPYAATPMPGGSPRGRPAISPAEETLGASETGLAAATTAATVSITGGCLTGGDLTGSEGLEVWSAGGPLTVTATGLEVKDWDYGMYVDGAGVVMNANHDAITSNVTAGYYGTVGPSHTAAYNWWGHASGPSGAGPGTGDAVSGATVAFTPWLITGADANPGCGFSSGPDNLITPGPAPGCISIGNPCITIPVDITRSTSDNVRGFSVNVQLSANLLLCTGPGSITEGTYLSAINGTNFQVIDNGGGNYTVDGSILGLPCGATAPSGNLFNIAVKKETGPDGTGTITLASPLLRDCVNNPVATSVGAPLNITIDAAAPSPIASLSAAQVTTGNDADGTTKITLSWPAVEAGTTVKLYRAGYGNYPEYDDPPTPGSVPATPGYPPGAPWALAASMLGPTSYADEVGTRDFWYYVAFVQDACGNVSTVSNKTGGTLNYHLGDTHNGSTNCVGNNVVNTSDISHLGANYGVSLAPLDPRNCIDVGPTTNAFVTGRPLTDNLINFEDLIIHAINFGVVSAPQDGPVAQAADVNALRLDVPASTLMGETFAVGLWMKGAGDIHGMSVDLSYDPAALEPIGVEAGDLLARQPASSVVLSAKPGNLDLALLGVGRGIAGEGVVARALFRAKTAGAPHVGLALVQARNAGNVPVVLGSRPGVVEGVTPGRTGIATVGPNPFATFTTIQLSLSQDGPVRLAVYDVAGREVKRLLDGVMGVGVRAVEWDGRGNAGSHLPVGFYILRLEAAGVVQSRPLFIVK